VKKELTQIEIKKIYQFVKQNGVPYIDLQHELVDHIAGDIEASWDNDSSKSFNQFLYDAYDGFKFEHNKKYPLSHFQQIVEEKTKSFQKYWFKNVMSYLKEYFKLPRIILTFLIFGLLMNLFTIGELQYLQIVCVSALLFMLVLSVYFYFKYKTEFKKYLTIKSFITFYWMYLFYMPYCLISIIRFLPIENFFFNNIIGQSIVSGLISIWVILSIGAVTTFPKILKRNVLKNLNIRLA